MSAQYTDETRMTVRYTDDAGRVSFVPVSEGNAMFRRLRDGDAEAGVDPTPIADPPAKTLAQAQAEAVATLETEYAARLAAGASWGGHVFDIRPDAAAMLDLVLAAVDRYGDAKHDGTWTDIAGADVVVTAAQLPALAEACFDRAAALGRRYRELMVAVLAASDVTAAAAVDVTAGWPA